MIQFITSLEISIRSLKSILFRKLVWSFNVWRNWSSDLNCFENSLSLASNLQTISLITKTSFSHIKSEQFSQKKPIINSKMNYHKKLFSLIVVQILVSLQNQGIYLQNYPDSLTLCGISNNIIQWFWDELIFYRFLKFHPEGWGIFFSFSFQSSFVSIHHCLGHTKTSNNNLQLWIRLYER